MRNARKRRNAIEDFHRFCGIRKLCPWHGGRPTACLSRVRGRLWALAVQYEFRGGVDETCQSSHTIDGDDHKIQLSLKNINPLSSSAVQQKLCGSSGCQRFSWLLAVSDCQWFPVAAWGVVACGSPWLLGLSGCWWLPVDVLVEWLCVVAHSLLR